MGVGRRIIALVRLRSMIYDLYIGDRTFSSWSLRGWLMMEKFNIAYRIHTMGLYSGTMSQDLAALAPARLVPVMKTPDGTVVGETIAMAETLAEAHPHAPMWPDHPGTRATARWLCAEMAAGFSALRAACPMQLQHINMGFQPTDPVMEDLERIEILWAHAATFRTEGPWLFGTYSLADVFYAPVCARIIGYNLPVGTDARAYCMTALRDPAFKAWRTQGLLTFYTPFPYPTHPPITQWPE